MERDKPRNGFIIGLVIGLCISLVLVVYGVAQYFDVAVRQEVQVKVLSAPSSALRAQRAREQQVLGHYGWVDKDKGIARIPVERAIELTLREWEQRPSGLVPVQAAAAATAPAAAPATAPAGQPPAATPAGEPQAAPAATPPATTNSGTAPTAPAGQAPAAPAGHAPAAPAATPADQAAPTTAPEGVSPR